MHNYSSEAYRAFKKFVGELTSSAAGIQAAMQHVGEMLASSPHADPWNFLASRYAIKVDGLHSDFLLASSSRLNLVSLYSGFDLFLTDFRSQYHDLYGTDWKKSNSDSPFDEIYQNARSTKSVLDAKIHLSRKTAIDYYRHVRNAVVHPKKSTIAVARSFFDDNKDHLDKVRLDYAMQSAPNSYDGLSFHDVKLLAKLLLDVLRQVDLEFDPGDEVLARQIDVSSFRRVENNGQRHRNAIKGALKERFGISDERAEKVLSFHRPIS